MAVIHIPEAEAAHNLTGLLAKVRAGEDVIIESDVDAFSVVRARKAKLQPRLLSEVLEGLRRNAANNLLDDQFGNDVEAGIKSHEHERLIDPWESF